MLCPESPRWLASQDNWDKASSNLSTVRQLPPSHPYIQAELLEMKTQLDAERGRSGGNSYWALTKEAWTITGNRRRAIMVIALMVAQQMTGTNAINVSSLSQVLCLHHHDNFFPSFIMKSSTDNLAVLRANNLYW